MNFVDDENVANSQKTKKDKLPIVAVVLLIAIFVVAMLIVVTLSSLSKMKTVELTLSLDGKNNSDFKNALIIEDDGTIYVPIRDVAGYFGYKSYNGNYANKSENVDECYIESKDEIVTFALDSTEIEKINTSNSGATYYTIDKPIKKINNKLYIEMDGIEIAYNLKAKYDETKNKIILETMNYIVTQNKDAVLKNGFKSISEKFNDKKAILENLVIVIGDSNKYGLYNIETKETILETKYDSIEFIPVTHDFTIKSNGSVGIKDNTGRDKIQTRYESIEFVGQKYKLYVVKKDGKFGVIDNTESPVIPIRYDRIGIDATAFPKNNIKNKYVLVNKIIPVKQNNTWALFDISGTPLTDFIYSGMGSNGNGGDKVLVIPDYDVIIVSKNRKYILITSDGNEVWGGREFDQVYLQFQNGVPNYYLVSNNRTYDALKYLGKTFGNKQTTEDTSEENNEDQNENQEEQEQDEENNNRRN